LSDGTLNPNGVRFGSADIYNIVEGFEEIADSLCVGQRNPNSLEEERVVLFLKVIFHEIIFFEVLLCRVY
jgi:acetoacetyl-CoA synthetase